MTKEKVLENNEVNENGCWIWKSCLNDRGYGQVWYEGKTQSVSRLMYQFVNGEVPEGMCVCHTCDTPSCMNPDHLFTGTRFDNTQDAVRKGRIAKGEMHGSAKLTEEDVKEVKKHLAAGVSQRKIGDQYGVHQQTISRIKTGTRWGWLE